MAKTRKSIVGDAFAPKQRPNAEQARKAAEEALSDPSSKMGRPKALHGYKRTSIQADPILMRRMKTLASRRGEYMYDTLNAAMEEYLERHE